MGRSNCEIEIVDNATKDDDRNKVEGGVKMMMKKKCYKRSFEGLLVLLLSLCTPFSFVSCTLLSLASIGNASSAVLMYEKQFPNHIRGATFISGLSEEVIQGKRMMLHIITTDRILSLDSKGMEQHVCSLATGRWGMVSANGQFLGIKTYGHEGLLRVFALLDVKGILLWEKAVPGYAGVTIGNNGNVAMWGTEEMAKLVVYDSNGEFLAAREIEEPSEVRYLPSDDQVIMVRGPLGAVFYDRAGVAIGELGVSPDAFLLVPSPTGGVVAVGYLDRVEFYHHGSLSSVLYVDGKLRRIEVASNGEFAVVGSTNAVYGVDLIKVQTKWKYDVRDPKLSVCSLAVNSDARRIAIGLRPEDLSQPILAGLVLLLDRSGEKIFEETYSFSYPNVWIPRVALDMQGLHLAVDTLENLYFYRLD